MSKEIKFSSDARGDLKKGVDILANTVKVTLGARGRTVLIRDDYGRNHPTKDGVTVARSIRLSDPVQNMGASLVTEVASKVADEAGDGTTTATVLTQAIVSEGLKNITAGANPIDLKDGINLAVSGIKEFLQTASESIGDSIERIEQVATISANNDTKIGKMIAEAIAKVGTETVITAEPSNSVETYVETVEGLEFNQGYQSIKFVTNPDKMSVEYENPAIFLLDGKLNTIDVATGLMRFSAENRVPLIIIASEISGDVLATLAINKLKTGLPIAAVKAPYMNDKRKEFLNDIATLTGAVVVSDDSGVGFESFTPDMLGGCKKIIIKKDTTAIIDGSGTKEEVEEKVQTLKTRLTDSKDPRDKKFLKERIAKLSGGVAVMYVGASTEAELKEKMDRVDDALAATRSAVEEGIVAGGGTTLVKSIPTIDFDSAPNEDQRTGMAIVAKAIKEPLLQIVRNAGVNNAEGILEEVIKGENDYGYDVKKGEYTSMKESGIIDPTKVVRTALESAASVAIILLTTEATVTQDLTPKE